MPFGGFPHGVLGRKAPKAKTRSPIMKKPFNSAAPLLGHVLFALSLLPAAAHAHGFAGQRFFPATLATDDPFVADELSLPTITSTRSNADADTPATRQTSGSIDFARRITPNFGLSLGASHLRISPEGQSAANGWDNIAIGAKYQLYVNEAHESIVSIGADWDVGGTGSSSVGADRFSTVTPTVYFGKGFGDLSTPALRPFAVTGTAGVGIPTSASTTTVNVDPDTGLTTTDVANNPHVLKLGFALEYSLPYLQSHVKDVGLGAPFDRMIPVVEFAMSKPLDRVDDRRYTGTVNPGVLWAGQKIQLGLEAVIPMNSRSGHGVGFIAQLHFFLDDIAPGTFGHPMFGGSR